MLRLMNVNRGFFVMGITITCLADIFKPSVVAFVPPTLTAGSKIS